MIITQNTYSRKRRLLEAFHEVDKHNKCPNDTIIESTAKKFHLIETQNETFRMDCSTDTSDLEKAHPIPPLLSSRVLHLFQVKLQIFEQWELKKRQALEKIYENVELLTNKEEKLEKLRSIHKEKEYKRKQLQNSIITNDDKNSSILISQIQSSQYTKLTQNNTNLKNQTPPLSLSSPPSSLSNKTYSIKESNQKIEKLIPIGPNGTLVSEKILQLINWSQPTAAVRKLLMTVFDRNTLAFHTLTGKPSPAFMGCNRPLKDQLNPLKVADIIYIVSKRSRAPERDIRSAITTKCADENKMFKQRQQRKDRLATLYHANKENFNYSKHNTTF